MLICNLCQEKLTGKPYELKRRLAASKSGLLFCSKLCKNEALRIARAGDPRFRRLVPQHYGLPKNETSKTCLNCSMRFLSKYPSQIYCSQGCSSRHRTRKLIDEWLSGNIEIARTTDGSLKAWAKRYILEENHYSCSKCRWSEVSENGTIPIEVDHIDGDWNNSSYSNLRALCPNCHSLCATYKVYNRGNNRAKG